MKKDNLYYEIKEFIIKEQRFSISLIQMYFRVTYEFGCIIRQKLINDYIINDKNKVLYEKNINPNQMNIFQIIE